MDNLPMLPPVAPLKNTSDIAFISSTHGRLRRYQRDISKRDLQSAVKYGTAERTVFGRWKFTYAGLIYITDPTRTQEITSYPQAANPIEKADISFIEIEEHISAKEILSCFPEKCESHTVIVIDQSGSMRKSDVSGYKSRSMAVFSTIALEFVEQALLHGDANNTDTMSIIAMRDNAEIVLEREPITMVLFNKLVDLCANSTPSYHGNYLPSLEEAEILLAQNKNCALRLVFISDGKPSDGNENKGNNAETNICSEITQIALQFQDILTVMFMGFAGKNENFSILKKMNLEVNKAGGSSNFVHCELQVDSLADSLRSSTTSLTKIRTKFAAGAMGAGRRVVRDVVKESSNVLRKFMEKNTTQGQHLSIDGGWEIFDSIKEKFTWSLEINHWKSTSDSNKFMSCGVAIRKGYFGDGAERLVFRLMHLDSMSQSCGPLFVAKESKFIPEDDKEDFHKVFCKTQQTAQQLAIIFNERLSYLSTKISPPKIVFLPSEVYFLKSSSGATKQVLVEKYLEGDYVKWNDNSGGIWIDNKFVRAPRVPLNVQEFERNAIKRGCGAILEEDNENEEIEDENIEEAMKPSLSVSSTIKTTLISDAEIHFSITDIPQAFSHFSYLYSGRKMMVCDLQGVLSNTNGSSIFELTDPVIHNKSTSGHKQVYGRTDRGHKGISQFFETHKCSEICRYLTRNGRFKKRMLDGDGFLERKASRHI